MKKILIKNLSDCPNCGSIPELLANARGYFQVRCLNCGLRTHWDKKIDSVLSWERREKIYFCKLKK